jgi:hypothetical protein
MLNVIQPVFILPHSTPFGVGGFDSLLLIPVTPEVKIIRTFQGRHSHDEFPLFIARRA